MNIFKGIFSLINSNKVVTVACSNCVYFAP